MDVVEPQVHEPGFLRTLRDKIDRHLGVKPGEVGLDLPETWPFAEFVRLLGEKTLFVGHEHARTEPFEGRETLVEAIGGRPRRIADIPSAAEMPLADMRGLVAVLLEQPRDRRQFRIEPVGLPDFGVARTRAGNADKADVGGEAPGQETRARR